ncbi:MAG TPA: hypothetical protein VMG62_07865 [Solirubrobacteraceae bacterium]|nr:hypothetical protein [Solirubrobacteraceae bacterium]
MARGWRIAAVVAAALVLALGIAQIVLPRVAASSVRGRVQRYGTVRSVSVSAFPAVKLLWKHADEVRVRAGSLSFQPGEGADLVAEGSGTERVVGSAEEVTVGPVQVRDVSFAKHGDSLRAEGTIDEEEVRQALPPGVSVDVLECGGGQVKARVGGELFGFGASVDAVARGLAGKLVVQAQAGFLGTVTDTLFEDPRVYVEGVDARRLSGSPNGEGSYRLTMWASVR